MPVFKENTGFKMESPLKTRLGRWLMGRKKHVDSSGKITITDKDNKVVKTKSKGVTTKYKKGSRKTYIPRNLDKY